MQHRKKKKKKKEKCFRSPQQDKSGSAQRVTAVIPCSEVRHPDWTHPERVLVEMLLSDTPAIGNFPPGGKAFPMPELLLPTCSGMGSLFSRNR